MHDIKSKLISLIGYIKVRYATIIAVILLVYGFPFSDMHTCELPNGDKVKHQTIYTVSLLGKILGSTIMYHTNAGQPDVIAQVSWYVPKGWLKSRSYLGEVSIYNYYESRDCFHNNMFGSLVKLYNGGLFLKIMVDLKPANISPHNNFSMLDDYSWELTPEEKKVVRLLPATTSEEQNKRSDFFDKIDKQRRKQYGLDDSLKLSYHHFHGKFGNQLWEEYGLLPNVKCEGGDYVLCSHPISAVWQSHSTDGGKTWSKPIITKDAKLFVIGKSIKEQPGVAKDKGTLKYIGWF